MFKRISWLVPALFLLLSPAGTTAWANEIRVGFMPYLPYTNVLYAKEKRMIEEELEKAGIDKRLRWVQFSSGGLVSEGMAAGELDVAILGIVPAAIGRAAGQDTRIIALGSTAPKSHALVARKDLNLSSVTELKGKRVATTYGSTVYELLYRILEEAGMTVRDIELINMQPPDMNISLRNKTIDAAVVWDPLLPRLRVDGVVDELRDGTGINDNINVIIARGAYLEDEPDAVAAMLRGIARANQEIGTASDEAAAMFATTFDLPKEVSKNALENYHYSLRVSELVKEQIKTSMGFLREERIIRRPVDVEAFLDLSFME